MSILEIFGICFIIWLIGFIATFIYLNIALENISPFTSKISFQSALAISAMWPVAISVSIIEKIKEVL